MKIRVAFPLFRYNAVDTRWTQGTLWTAGLPDFEQAGWEFTVTGIGKPSKGCPYLPFHSVFPPLLRGILYSEALIRLIRVSYFNPESSPMPRGR